MNRTALARSLCPAAPVFDDRRLSRRLSGQLYPPHVRLLLCQNLPGIYGWRSADVNRRTVPEGVWTEVI